MTEPTVMYRPMPTMYHLGVVMLTIAGVLVVGIVVGWQVTMCAGAECSTTPPTAKILLWVSGATALGLTMGGALAMTPLRQRASRSSDVDT